MKKNKALKLLILSGLIVVSTSLGNFSSAEEKNIQTNDQSVINILTEGNSDVQIREITREEYVENLAENEGISLKEADKLATERSNEAMAQLEREMPEIKEKERGSSRANDRVWRQATWVEKYSGNRNYSAQLSASFEVWSNGSFRQITDCTLGSDIAPGSSEAEWTQINKWSSKGSLPASEATVGVTGAFKVKTTYTGGASGGIAGFLNVTGSSSGTTTWKSHDMTIQKQWSVY